MENLPASHRRMVLPFHTCQTHVSCGDSNFTYRTKFLDLLQNVNNFRLEVSQVLLKRRKTVSTLKATKSGLRMSIGARGWEVVGQWSPVRPSGLRQLLC